MEDFYREKYFAERTARQIAEQEVRVTNRYFYVMGLVSVVLAVWVIVLMT